MREIAGRKCNPLTSLDSSLEGVSQGGVRRVDSAGAVPLPPPPVAAPRADMAGVGQAVVLFRSGRGRPRAHAPRGFFGHNRRGRLPGSHQSGLPGPSRGRGALAAMALCRWPAFFLARHVRPPQVVVAADLGVMERGGPDSRDDGADPAGARMAMAAVVAAVAAACVILACPRVRAGQAIREGTKDPWQPGQGRVGNDPGQAVGGGGAARGRACARVSGRAWPPSIVRGQAIAGTPACGDLLGCVRFGLGARRCNPRFAAQALAPAMAGEAPAVRAAP